MLLPQTWRVLPGAAIIRVLPWGGTNGGPPPAELPFCILQVASRLLQMLLHDLLLHLHLAPETNQMFQLVGLYHLLLAGGNASGHVQSIQTAAILVMLYMLVC